MIMCLVMLFGFNASTFMQVMNKFLYTFIVKFVVVYFKDLLVIVPGTSYICNIKGSTFNFKDIKFIHCNKQVFLFIDKVLFFVYMVSKDGISIDQSRVYVFESGNNQLLYFL